MSETLSVISRFQRIKRILRQAINGEEQEFTSGSMDRAIVLLAIPMILEMAMESLFAIVDAFFVSKVGVDAVATVGLTESVLTIVYSLGIGLSAAATAMVSRRVGEGNREAAARAGAQTILIAVILSMLIAVPGYLYGKELLEMMSESSKVAAGGQYFTRIMLACNLPILLLWMLNGVFRGAGDAATAMRALWIANAINIVLDPLLIFGVGPFPELGVTGAAVATTIGRSTGVVYQLWQMFGVGRIIRLKIKYFQPDPGTIRRLLVLAAGSTGQYLIGSMSWLLMIKILAHISTSVTAGYTIAIRMIIFTILPSWGMANAAATLVGQNLGAEQPDRAEKSVWRAGYFNMLYMAFVSVAYLWGAPFFIGLFSTEPEVVEAGSMALRIIVSGYVFYGYGMMFLQAINGAGDTRTPTLLNFICFWLIQIPLALFLCFRLNFGQTGVYYSIVAGESSLAVLAYWTFKKGRWKTVKV
jgi:putative MATE family efflux protein